MIEVRMFPLPKPKVPQARIRLWLTEEQAKELYRYLRKNPSKKREVLKDMERACEVGPENPMFTNEKGRIFRCWVGSQYRLVGLYSFAGGLNAFVVIDQWEKKRDKLQKQEQARLDALDKNSKQIVSELTYSNEPYWSE